MEEQGNEDVDQQKKVKFEEKGQEEETPRKKETKENKDTKENKEHHDEETEEEGRRSRASRSSRACSAERRRKEKEFFHAELQRLKDSLRKESKKIKKPKEREHYPYVFTNLRPYYDTYTANYLINMPDLGYKESQPENVKTPKDDVNDLPYTSRNTAIGLCDPCVSLSMDMSVLPKLETAEIRRKRIEQMHARESKPNSGRASSNTDRSGKTGSQSNNDDTESPRQKRPEAKQGSTRLPKFPVIAPPDSELATKELHYGDVQMLREEVVKKFSHYGEGRKKSDYERTKQDFYRMELDRFDEYHDLSKPRMRAAYFAYLQNTPGSRKAIYDCVKEVTNPKKKEEQSPQAVA